MTGVKSVKTCKYDEIYSVLKAGIKCPEPIIASYCSPRWAAVETETGMGMCMYVPGRDCYEIAAINSFYNRGTEHYLPLDRYYTEGMDFTGKTVGVVGHMTGVKAHHKNEAKEMYYFELVPQDADDLPAEMEDELLPRCDIVVITGSTLVNGTLPHILELCESAYTVLTGPSVPMCEALFDMGIDRLAGLCISDVPTMRHYIQNNIEGIPYPYATPFMLAK